MKKKNSDQLFSQLLSNDSVGQPNTAIEDRLMYSYLLKNGSSKLRQNSFAGFFGWMFSFQGLGFKTGMVSLVLFFTIANNHLSFESNKVSGNDSTFMNKVLVADSAHFIQSVDSIRKDSLN